MTGNSSNNSEVPLNFNHLRTLEQPSWIGGTCVYSPDGRFIASACKNSVYLWDSTSGQLLHILEGHTHFVNDCAISPDNQLLASASNDGSIRVWDTNTGHHLCTKQVYRMVEACAFYPDGNTIVSVDWENTIHKWDTTRDQGYSGGMGIFENRDSLLHFCALSPDGKKIIYIRFYLGMQVWDFHTGEVLLELEGKTREVSNCSFSPDGCMIQASGKEIWLWDAASGERIKGFEGHTGYIWGSEFSPDGRFLLSASEDKSLRAWEISTGRMVGMKSFPEPLKSLALHPWRPQMVCANKNGHLDMVELGNINYGPLIIAAAREDHGFRGLCPVCQHRFQIRENQIGTETNCPQEGCSTPLQISSLVFEKKSNPGADF